MTVINDICELRPLNLDSAREDTMFSNKQLYLAPASLSKIAHWALRPARYRFIVVEPSRVAQWRPIELSRTIVLVTKATRCHRAWISVVADVERGIRGGQRKGCTTKGVSRVGNGTGGILFSRSRVQMPFSETHGTQGFCLDYFAIYVPIEMTSQMHLYRVHGGAVNHPPTSSTNPAVTWDTAKGISVKIWRVSIPRSNCEPFNYWD